MSLLGRFFLSMWAFFWAALATIGCSLLFLAGVPFDRRRTWIDVVQRLHARLVLASAGIRLRVEGREHLAEVGPCIVMANHRSYLDTPALDLAASSRAIRFATKRELTRIPILGWAVAASPHIKVDRSDRIQAITALTAAVARIQGNEALVVFPEGTRARDLRLLPFKKGGFHVAVDSGLPIVPVSIRNSGRLLGKGSLLLRPGTIEVTIHPPVAVVRGQRRDVPRLVSQVRAAIASGLEGPAESPAPVSGPDGKTH